MNTVYTVSRSGQVPFLYTCGQPRFVRFLRFSTAYSLTVSRYPYTIEVLENNDEKMWRIIPIRLTPDQYAKVKALAGKREVSVAEVIRGLISKAR